ncbi:hypothetical protein C7413_11434 [Paraburkholderia silvatlantica]|nr:hypothetical protein C7411_11534 [Paraburkholderia silvatlantica]PXW36590.1 hypothetical protein C7413_11434 [Paraburkholderia silvatlantica]TDQ98978.1 hypothetical protein C7412_104195 [Paraburkholderia silvatlantica]
MRISLSELVQVVDHNQVMGQSFSFNPKNWERYLEVDVALAKLGYTEEQRASGFSLSRQAVIGMLQSHDLVHAAVLVLIWGYPRGVVGPGNQDTVRATLRAAQKIGDEMATATGDSKLDVVISKLLIPYVGISTLSKILYFAGLQTQEGRALIYDQMVMRALHYHRFDEYGDWPEYKSGQQRQTYAHFVRRTKAAAEKLGCSPDVIEYALFSEGQRLGPGKKTKRNIYRPVIEGGRNQLCTLKEQVPFEFEKYDDGCIKFFYGRDLRLSTKIHADDIQGLRRCFNGMSVPLTCKSGESIDGWLRENVTKVRVASYVGPVLIHLGYASRDADNISFPALPDE